MASLIAQLDKEYTYNARLQLNSWVGKIHWRRDRLPTPIFLGFPGGSVAKESTCNAGDLGSISGLERSPGERKDYPLQYSGLENSMGCPSPWGCRESDTTEQLALSMTNDVEHFSCSSSPSGCLLWWSACSELLLIWKIVQFSYWWLLAILCIFWTQVIRYMRWQRFFS